MAVRWAIVKDGKEVFSLGWFFDYIDERSVQRAHGYKCKLEEGEEIKVVGKYKKEVK